MRGMREGRGGASEQESDIELEMSAELGRLLGGD